MNAICYTNPDTGRVSILWHVPDCRLSSGVVGRKDVPPGVQFWIVHAADIPSDRSDRDAWELDIARPSDGQGLDFGKGSEWDVLKISDNHTYFYVRRTNKDGNGNVLSYDHRIVNAMTNDVVATTQKALNNPEELEHDNGSKDKPAKESRTRKKKTKS